MSPESFMEPPIIEQGSDDRSIGLAVASATDFPSDIIFIYSASKSRWTSMQGELRRYLASVGYSVNRVLDSQSVLIMGRNGERKKLVHITSESEMEHRYKQLCPDHTITPILCEDWVDEREEILPWEGAGMGNNFYNPF